ncbi:MAG TPA: PP0621 family protein [Thauera sp.]|jgi:uncharacterized protein|nr:PP0621 family protein [Thauera sp.]HRA81117.1 PP0621 family protein [Thauera sp.]
MRVEFALSQKSALPWLSPNVRAASRLGIAQRGGRGCVIEFEGFQPLGDPCFAPPIVRNLLILILVVAGIWWFGRVLTRAKEKIAEVQRAAQKRGGRAVAAPEQMCECAHCGVNVPESDGVREGGRFYCCDAHRLSGPRAD